MTKNIFEKVQEYNKAKEELLAIAKDINVSLKEGDEKVMEVISVLENDMTVVSKQKCDKKGACKGNKENKAKNIDYYMIRTGLSHRYLKMIEIIVSEAQEDVKKDENHVVCTELLRNLGYCFKSYNDFLSKLNNTKPKDYRKVKDFEIFLK